MAPEPQSKGLLANLKARWDQYIGIKKQVFSSASYYFPMLFQELWSGNTGILRNLSTVRDKAFAKWWIDGSTFFLPWEDTTAVPSLVSSAYGTILDLGAGNGNQLPRLDKSRIGHVYGIEPNAAFAPALAAKIRETGLEGTYTPIVCGVEDAELELARAGVAPGTVDCILSIQILCSVRDPRAVVLQLHHLLRPGGELIFWEHQRNESDVVSAAAQWVWNLIWPTLLGGCQLNRPTKRILLESAEWEVVEMDTDEKPASVMPRFWGRLRKPALPSS